MSAPHLGDPLAPARAAFLAPETRHATLPEAFALELGGTLRDVRVAYRTWGDLSAARDNAVVVCHALTGSADADRWWTEMFGPGRALDPDRDFIVCSNLLGSCYGTTGPASPAPGMDRPWLRDFPALTVRDMVRVQRELLRLLGVEKVRLALGGSLGGMQVLEWGLLFPGYVEAIAPIACGAAHTAWAIGLSEAQRQAIYADPRWRDGRYDPADPPVAGLAAARMMAMCSYRDKASFEERFGRRAQGADLFAVESYLRYQGRQLVERFDAATYVALTRAMDTHDVGRGRGERADVLRSLRLPTLVVSIDSDILYFPDEQEELAREIPGARLVRLASQDGHDAFLIDVEWMSNVVAEFRGRAPSGRARISRPASQPRRLDLDRPEVSVLVLGKGRVGSELLDQLARQRAKLERDYDVGIRVVGVADRHGLLWHDDGIDLADWRAQLAAAPAGGPFRGELASRALHALGREPNPVLVDVTAADDLGDVYAEAFRCGAHVVSSNKRPLAAPWAERADLAAVARKRRLAWHHGAAVGASLPVLDTLADLVRAGDRVREIEASLSGTLGFVTSELMRGQPLSLVVRWARELGYTEGDPRDDLSGLDSARKLVILARELGLSVEVRDVRREPLVPPGALAPGTLPELYAALRRHDHEVAARCARLHAQGKALRYLARLTVCEAGFAAPGTSEAAAVELEVGPAEVDASHRAAGLQGAEAYVAFTTDRRQALPLVVRGAGVGASLTAGAVLADIFRLARGRGAR